MYQSFSQNMKTLFIRAQDIALVRQKESFSFEEIAWALAHLHLEDALGEGAKDVFVMKKPYAEEARNVEAFVDEGEKRPDLLYPHAAEDVEHVIETAELRRPEENNNIITLQQFIDYAWPHIEEMLADILELPGTNNGKPDIKKTLSLRREQAKKSIAEKMQSDELDRGEQKKSVVDHITDPPHLDESMIGRTREIEISRAVLCKQFRSIPFFYGPSGAGLTTFLSYLPQELESDLKVKLGRDPVFKWLEYKQLINHDNLFPEIDREKLNALQTWLQNNPQIILLINEVENNDAFFEWLGKFYDSHPGHWILWSTKQDFKELNESSLDILYSYHHPVKIQEPEEENLKKILSVKFSEYYGKTDISIQNEAFSAICALSKNIQDFHAEPKRALKLMDHVVGFAKLRGMNEIDSSSIEQYKDVVWGKTQKERRSDFTLPQNLEAALKKKVYGQDLAIARVANVVRLAKFQLDSSPERPDGVFLFTGPSGVGKTELAQAVNDTLYGTRDSFYRLDMSEFTQEHMVHELIGSPHGFLGFEETPALLRFLEEHREGVLLLDEFEKAHSKVHRLFMNVFDSGRLTSARGTVYNLGGITIVATLNIMSEKTTRPTLGFVPSSEFSSSAKTDSRKIPWQELKEVFPVELLNRFDEIISFAPLDKKNLKKIVQDKTIEEARKKFEERFNLKVEFEQRVIDFIVEQGFSEELGFRSIQRMFQRMVLMPMLKYIERTDVRGEKVTVFLKDNKVDVSVEGN